MRVFNFIIVFILFSVFANATKLKEGTYRAVLILNEKNNIELPFNFEVKYKNKKPFIIIRNADERIVVEEITIKGDSLNFKMPIFDTEFRTIILGNTIEGIWINHYKTSNNIIKFKATYGETNRFPFLPGKVNPCFEGRWETTFSPNTKDSSKAIGVFHHVEQTDYVTGTFLTETGDYRYLEGMKHDDNLYLSSFDGSHAFLFIAKIDSSKILNGIFYSGASWQEPWIAKLNNNFKLRNANEITFVKNKDEKINFSFFDLEKNKVSLSDKKFENKPVIIQLMGSWCPNCMDESAYFSNLYKQYTKDGLEIIALAFEKTTDFEKSKQNLLRLKNKFNIDYSILITQQIGKEKAGEAFPLLNKIIAFPTILFLNKQHQIVKTHTGFSGPATGKAYDDFKQSTENTIKQLLKE